MQMTASPNTPELTPEQVEFIETKLSSKYWRMNNLYKIRDKSGTLVTLRLNKSQEKVLQQYKHNKKIILKSRQQGISTLYLAYNLDDCLFKEGYSAGIQSYGQDEADKLSKRAEIMWDELDPDIKELLGLKLKSNNSKGMAFSNGSVLKIGNFRGDTLQGLHVSELGKIAKKYPEKAKELKTGAFQAVSIDNKITIESTAEGQTGLFYEMWNRATVRANSDRPLTSLDFQPIFLSWLEDPDCQLFEDYPAEPWHLEYQHKLEEELGIKLTEPQKNWLHAKLEELGEDFDQEYPATPERAFAQSVDGTYFKHQYRRLIDQKRIIGPTYDDRFPVYVSFDLGLNDEMVILFAQVIDGQVIIIDEYHNVGHGIEFYINVLNNMKYAGNYKRVFLPHDANVRELGTGRTRIETFRRNGVTNITLLKRLSFQESIQAARQLIDSMQITDNCENMVLGIQNYRKRFDKRLGVYLPTDEHDIHSNYAASLRYMAQGLSTHSIAKTGSKETIQRKHRKMKQISGFSI